MLRTRLMSSAKLLWMPGNEAMSYVATRLGAGETTSFARQPRNAPPARFVVQNRALVAHSPGPNFFKRILRKLSLPNLGTYRRRVHASLLYDDIVQQIDYAYFFSELKLADTFYSWFVITELHVWMMMTRYMEEGEKGQDMRNTIVEIMWQDVDARKSKLGKANPAMLKNQVKILSQQFNAAIIGYDEGITSDDKVLAGALWRRFWQCECNNPESVEKLVAYVRKQMAALDELPGGDVLHMRKVKWLDFRNP